MVRREGIGMRQMPLSQLADKGARRSGPRPPRKHTGEAGWCFQKMFGLFVAAKGGAINERALHTFAVFCEIKVGFCLRFFSGFDKTRSGGWGGVTNFLAALYYQCKRGHDKLMIKCK